MDLIVVDTSALMAVLLNEPDTQQIADRLAEADRRLMSAANYFEFGAVLSGRNPGEPMHVNQDINQFISAAGIELAPVTVELARTALTARSRWGKGFCSPAGLNFGDCFAYALAKSEAAPLLFVGDDFSKTDLLAALQR